MEIEGIKALLSKFKGKLRAALKDKNKSVTVGYEAPHALVVHEDLEAAHGAAFNIKHAAEIAAGTEKARGENQQAKFLEQPARQYKDEIATVASDAIKRGVPLIQALYLAGLFLQRKSMEIVPVDKNKLKPSAFTVIE